MLCDNELCLVWLGARYMLAVIDWYLHDVTRMYEQPSSKYKTTCVFGAGFSYL